MNATRSLFVAFAILFLGVGPACGQGLFVGKGWGAEGTYLLKEGSHKFELSAGYAPSKWFDAGVFFERYGTDNKTLKYVGIGPQISVYPVRQSASFPLTIYGRGWYAKEFMSGSDIDTIEAGGGDPSQNSWTVGGAVTTIFGAWGESRLQPNVGLYYTSTSWKIEGGADATEQTDTSTWYEIGLQMVVGEEGFRIFHIGPLVRIDDNETTYGLTLGFGSIR